jgi:flagellar motility protein MotE (MotC chaperone)
MTPIRDFRLIPIVLLATGSLLALKVLGLVLDGGYLFVDTGANSSDVAVRADTPVVSPPATMPAPPPLRGKTTMRDLFNVFDITGGAEQDEAARKQEGGAKSETPAKSEATAPAKSKPAEPTPSPGGTVIPVDNDRPVSPAERAILGHLQERRQELEARAREIDIRDNLIKEAESRLDARAAELKDTEARITAATQKKEELEVARLKGLVVMYENMKPKDAAKIFDRLDMKILVELVTQINPRKMSDIMAQMQPDNAERLTAELAAKGAGAGLAIENLPKIEGKPNVGETPAPGGERNPNGT